MHAGSHCSVCGGGHHIPAEQTRRGKKRTLFARTNATFLPSLSLSPPSIFLWRMPIPHPDLSCPTLCVLSCPFLSLSSLSSSRYFLTGWCRTAVPLCPCVYVALLVSMVIISSADKNYRYLEGLVSTEGGWTRRGCQHVLLC